MDWKTYLSLVFRLWLEKQTIWLTDFFWYSGHGLNNSPFDDRTCLDHLNTQLVRYSDPNCTLFMKVPLSHSKTLNSSLFQVKAISSSVPVTPMSEEKMKGQGKKVKGSSPAAALLERSATWLSSLSGSKSHNNKERKGFKMSTQRTKRSLTSLFEAVSSSATNAASTNNNNNSQVTTNSQKQPKM